MKPLLLHGPAINNSRSKLSAIKQNFDTNNVVVFENDTPITEVLGFLTTSSLLPEEKLFILENPPEDFANYQLPTTNYQLILWFDHEISEKKKVIEWTKKNGEVLFFPESKEVSVFPFLDYLSNRDMKAFLEIKKLKQGSFDVFYFLTMTFYFLRNLVNIPKNAPEFVKQKMIRQRKNFDFQKITKLYKDILEIDFKLKSGLLEKDQAEFLLVNNFITE